ncbi:hypothetical protein OG533_36145 [Streptomyces sp. NBC_01186]|uniref:hypothetical protein n=1 Tax=Streptomyces sp. NBC_01186 TaxID=2903765 RepID=UPI002E155E52|nr:hypothetical protein OG533_36145 [Streptomyces sp. NBC_01186]
MVAPEAAAVVRASSSVLRGVVNQASGTPSLPNMHEGLIELHEILREWCEAARSTSKVVELILADQPHLAKAAHPHSNHYAGPVPFRRSFARRTLARRTRREIDALMSPSAPLAQKWSGTRRRQAARRNLRSMMHVYCPDLLSEFDRAVEARVAWVDSHHAELNEVINSRRGDGRLSRVRHEMTVTADKLETVRAELSALIQERYPMGAVSD